MRKPENRRFTWQMGGTEIKHNESTLDRHALQGVFHRRIRIIIPQLQELSTQHPFGWEPLPIRLRRLRQNTE